MQIPRRTYADHYGPTTGDRIRLADTDLLIRIDHDATVYGDEAKFGGGKVIRDGMGQSAAARGRPRARRRRRARPARGTSGGCMRPSRPFR